MCFNNVYDHHTKPWIPSPGDLRAIREVDPSILLQMALFHCFFMAEYYSIVYTYHIFFIYPSVDGYFGCFHILAVINSDTSCWNRLSFMLVVRNFWLDHRKQGVGGNSENMVLMAFTSIGHPLCTTHLSPSPRPLPQSSSCSGLHVAV